MQKTPLGTSFYGIFRGKSASLTPVPSRRWPSKLTPIRAGGIKTDKVVVVFYDLGQWIVNVVVNLMAFHTIPVVRKLRFRDVYALHLLICG